MADRLTILMDITITAHSRGGVGRYVTRLADALRTLAAEDPFISFRTIDVPAARPGTHGVPCIVDQVLQNPVYLSIPLLRRIPLKLGSEQKSRRSRLLRAAGESTGVFHHSGVQPVFPAGWRSVVTHFDPSAIDHPEWHTAETVSYALRERSLILAGSGVLAISRWAADQAESCFGLPPGSVGTAPGAADPVYTPGEPDPEVLTEYGLVPGGYVLHVGSFVPRKNIPFMLEVYGDCVNCGFNLPLVLVGAEEWKFPSSIHRKHWMKRLSVPDDGRLLHLYRGARAVLLPSRYEGLGFPALEALACHRPLLCSNATALPDTAGKGGLLMDPTDRDAWGRAILSLDDPGRIGTLEEMASCAPRPTWDDAASKALQFYRRLSP